MTVRLSTKHIRTIISALSNARRRSCTKAESSEYAECLKLVFNQLLSSMAPETLAAATVQVREAVERFEKPAPDAWEEVEAETVLAHRGGFVYDMG